MAERKSGSSLGRSRGPKIRVRKLNRRSVSSTRWLERHLNDPYVAEAKRQGFRSRAAFKLIELDEQFGILKGAKAIVDLGAAPGGWSQYLAKQHSDAKIVAMDLLEIEPIPGITFIQKDFLDDDAEEVLFEALSGEADLVLSDMAPAATGHKNTDNLRTMALCEAAYDYAIKVLKPGGHFVAKVLRGGTDHQLLARMRHHFGQIKHAKPPSSRAESSEWFVVAKNFKGRD
ncbi:MAG: RlmE family RNA methyltransferase [Sphingomonadales bacterium]